MEGQVLETKIVDDSNPDFTLRWALIENESVAQGSLWTPQQVFNDGRIINPKWLPLPGSQYSFLQCPIYECLFEGTRGPGKTATLIMDFAKDCGKGLGKNWRGVLFRREYKDLDEVVRQIEALFPDIFPGFVFKKSKADYSACWATGETLLLRQLEKLSDYDNYHGHQYPWMGFEELTQWEDDKVYKKMFSCSRPTAQGVLCRIRATTNPSGPGHNWVKKRFRLPDSRGKVITDEKGLQRVAIHGSLSENFLLLHADPQYPQKIMEAADNPAEEAAWVYGSWDVTSGGMFDDLWDAQHHVLPDFPINIVPKGWNLTRAYDHGQSRPFAVGWFLESNGEPIQWNGQLIGRIRGDTILWREWYGRESEDQPNVGLRMSSSRIAEGIRDRQNDWNVDGIAEGGPADSEIYTANADKQGRSPADDMEDEGVVWERADKSAGSRSRGWQRFRNMLEGAVPYDDGTREHPGFFVTDSCRWFIDIVPTLPRDQKDPDDIPKTSEDHLADMCRYRLSWESPRMWRKSF